MQRASRLRAGHRTCSGDVLISHQHQGTLERYTLAPDGRSMSTGAAVVATRIGPRPGGRPFARAGARRRSSRVRNRMFLS